MTEKRLFDLLCGLVGLAILSPLFIVVAVVIRLDTAGPVFFRQARVGRNGVLFRIHKFRTMRVEQATDARLITIGRDPRVTSAGAILRKTKLDELPQLIDVLYGSMSIVGPRPEVPKYVEFYPEAAKNIVLSVRPGITDECSLKLIDESDLLSTKQEPEKFYIEELIPLKLSYHLDYVRHRSMGRDIKIIFDTIRGIFR